MSCILLCHLLCPVLSTIHFLNMVICCYLLIGSNGNKHQGVEMNWPHRFLILGNYILYFGKRLIMRLVGVLGAELINQANLKIKLAYMKSFGCYTCSEV